MALDLEGRKVLVTGGARGIGKAVAKEMLLEGADVALLDVEAELVRKAQEELSALRANANVLIVHCDVRDPAQVEQAAREVFQALGSVDVLVNSAGLIRKALLPEITVDDWDLQFNVNVRGTFLMCQTIVRHWLKFRHRGRIINISSVHGKISFPDASAYAATKGAVNMFTRSLASELAPFKINVNALAPGATDTELNIPFYTPSVRQAMAKRIPWGEIGDPSDVGHAAAFLASDKARYITGEILYVDGGLAMDGREVIE